MKLRRADSSDNVAIAEILRIAFSHSFKNEANAAELDAYLATLDERYFSKLLSTNSSEFILSLDTDERITGFAQLDLCSPDPSSNEQWLKLERLYISPELIGQGIGAMLMEAYLARAIENGADQAWLQVLRSNHRAVEFYGRYGFEPFNTSPAKFKADHEIDIWMRKKLP